VLGAVAAMLMSLSTVVVAVNAQLLRRLDLRVDPVAGGAGAGGEANGRVLTHA
jgi:hypothetical protein